MAKQLKPKPATQPTTTPKTNGGKGKKNEQGASTPATTPTTANQKAAKKRTPRKQSHGPKQKGR